MASELPDFNISTGFTGQNFFRGSFVNDNPVTLTSLNGFTGTVSLVASVSPVVEEGIIVQLTQTNVTLSSDGNGVSTLGIYSSSLTPIQNYTVTVTGASGSLSHSVTVKASVMEPSGPPPSFVMIVSPSYLSFPQGFGASSTITVESLNGFAEYVYLSVSVNPFAIGFGTGLSTPLSLPPNGTVSSALSVTARDTTPARNYTLVVTASSAIFSNGSWIWTHFVRLVQLIVTPLLAPAFIIDVTGGGVGQGNTHIVGINMLSLKGFQGFVNLTGSIFPLVENGPTISSISPNPAQIPAGSTGAAYATIPTSYSTPIGTYTISVTATSGNLSHTASATFTVVEYHPPSRPPDASPLIAHLEYRLSYYSEALHPGGSVVFVNEFTNIGQLVVRVSQVTVQSDFGTSSSSQVAMLHPGEAKVLNVTVPIALMTVPGNYTVTGSAGWQYYANSTGWTTPSSSPISVQGVIPIRFGLGPLPLSQTVESLLSSIGFFGGAMEKYAWVIAAYFAVVFVAVFLAIVRERARQIRQTR